MPVDAVPVAIVAPPARRTIELPKRDAPSPDRLTRSDAAHVNAEASREALQSLEAPQSLEAIVRHHTATQPNLQLNVQLVLQSLLTGLPLLVVDILIAATAMLASASVINLWQGHVFNPGVWKQLPAWLVIQTGLFWLHGLYPGAGVSAISELRAVVRSAVYSCLCLASLNLIFGHLPRIEFAFFVATTAMVMAASPLGRHLVRAVLSMTSWWGIRTLMIGSLRSCERLCKQVQSRRESGLMIVGYVSDQHVDQNSSDPNMNNADPNRLGCLHDALLVARHHRAPIAAIASDNGSVGSSMKSSVKDSVKDYWNDRQPLLAQRLMFQFPSLIWLDPSAVFPETSNPIGEFNQRLNVPFLRFTPRLLKRTLDLSLVIPGLLLLAIPMALVAIAIKWKSPGPVFYGSPRIGQQGRRFKMWKFRSMVTDADEALARRLSNDPEARIEWEATQKLKDDPRIIPGIGRFLRSSSLDELPQLWNVLVGQMSLVGPRPVPPGEIVKYQQQYYQYSHMWPGITGLWQVSGRNDTTFETRVLLVGHYAANWSLWLDAWILVKTPLTVLTRKGAY